jgi:nicotinamidase-related amidase
MDLRASLWRLGRVAGSETEEKMTQKSYAGADPFALTRFMISPGRTALVVVDMQNDFLHDDGWYAQQGIDISHMQASIAPTASLVREARSRGVPVIWTRHGFRDTRDAGIFAQLRPFLKKAVYARAPGVMRFWPIAARRPWIGTWKNSVFLPSSARILRSCCDR